MDEVTPFFLFFLHGEKHFFEMVILRGLECTKNKLKYAKKNVMASSYSWKKVLRYVHFQGILEY